MTGLESPPPALARPSRNLIIISSIATLLVMLILRYVGPSDLFDQTQPKTISYTTDIIVHGGSHWLLPIERGELPATKPPLYNWLAVPGVKWLGFGSEIAHKLPSLAAMLGCWLIIVRMGRALGRSHDADESMGWLAGLIFACNYSIFKLAYLARPDMLLTLWILIAWMCATRAFMLSGGARPALRASSSEASAGQAPPLNALLFWLAITLAGLTKGPAVFVVIVYAIIAARVIDGRWSAIRSLHPIIGGTIALIICGAWVFAVWKINPTHVKQELWFNEIYGRVTGTGAEGTGHGTRVWLKELPYQVFYYATRFVPWSFIALLGGIALWRSRLLKAGATETNLTRWMRASLLFIIIVVGLFSLSVGKRADYVAVAYPQTAFLAAWWLLYSPPRIARRWPWLIPIASALNLASITVYDHQQIWSPVPGFGDAIKRFADQASDAMSAQPAPVLNCSAGQTHLQAVLGIAEDDQRRQVAAVIDQGQPFWVIAGRTQNAPREFDQWLAQKRLNAKAVEVIRSAELPRAAGWPEQVTLWLVTSQ